MGSSYGLWVGSGPGIYCTLHTLQVKEVYTPCYLCEDVVREGSLRFAVLEPPRTSAYCTLHTVYPLKRCSWRRFSTVEPQRTFSNYILTEIARCRDFFHLQGVQGALCTGSGRFKHSEPHRTFSNYILLAIFVRM